MSRATKSTKPVIGWHMTIIFGAFFGVVGAVNFNMARLAIQGFGGTVVDNSYVASQHYNDWLDKAKAQDALGWEEQITIDEARHVTVSIKADDTMLAELRAVGKVVRPIGQREEISLDFQLLDSGILRSTAALPAGRWRAELTIRHNTDIARYRQELQ